MSFYHSNFVGFYTAQIDLTKSGLFVSVDRRNEGAGFGSPAGPTYPLSTYAYLAPTNFVDPYNSYALDSAVTIDGYDGFCPPANGNGCANGIFRIATVGGGYFTVAYGFGNIGRSEFSSTSPTPAPTSD